MLFYFISKQKHLVAEMSLLYIVCAVLENVRTELMKSPVLPYVPGLSMWADKVM